MSTTTTSIAVPEPRTETTPVVHCGGCGAALPVTTMNPATTKPTYCDRWCASRRFDDWSD